MNYSIEAVYDIVFKSHIREEIGVDIYAVASDEVLVNQTDYGSLYLPIFLSNM